MFWFNREEDPEGGREGGIDSISQPEFFSKKSHFLFCQDLFPVALFLWKNPSLSASNSIFQ